MTKRCRVFVAGAIFAGALVMLPGTARAQDAQTCQPGLANQFFGPHQTLYTNVYLAVIDEITAFTTELNALVGQTPTYDTLLAHAQAVAAEVTNGRVVLTLPDGTVVVDTSKANNTYANFLAKAINENHNSRVAFMEAQQYPCGVAIESKRSSTTGFTESYVAIRLGNHLDSEGTVRMSAR